MVLKVAILGAGTIGCNLAILLAKKDFEVILWNRRKESFDRIKKYLSFYDAKEDLLQKIKFRTELDDIKDSDIIVECVVENFEIKRELFKKLEKTVTKQIVCTTTSSLTISSLFNNISYDDKAVGLHFFNPINKINFVEIAPYKSKEAINFVKSFMDDIGFEYVIVKDVNGFILNRLLFPLINEAMDMVDKKIATVKDIDKTMAKVMKFKPLRLADLIGLDICLEIIKNIGVKPSKLLQEKVNTGKLGKKAKEGFYKYN